MTLVLAMVDDQGNIYAGADSAIGDENEIYEFHEPKVFTKGPYLFGYCQSARLGQVLRYHFEGPEPLTAQQDLNGFMLATLWPGLRHLLETHSVITSGSVEMMGITGRQDPATGTVEVGGNVEGPHHFHDLLMTATVPHLCPDQDRWPLGSHQNVREPFDIGGIPNGFGRGTVVPGPRNSGFLE